MLGRRLTPLPNNQQVPALTAIPYSDLLRVDGPCGFAKDLVRFELAMPVQVAKPEAGMHASKRLLRNQHTALRIEKGELP